jgi:D-aspartate ligase
MTGRGIMGHDIPAVVLDLSATGIGIVRSLAEKRIQVFAFDTKGKYEIGKTRYATCGICPNPVF